MEAKIDRNEAKLVSLATEQANSDREHCQAMYYRWRQVQGYSPLQDLKSMMVLLKCFPTSVLSLTRYPKWRENTAIGLALDALHNAHEYACCILGRRASQLGLNGGVVEIGGEHCRRILRDDPAAWATDPKDGTWPNCIWGRRKSLPMEVRRTIEEAQTVLTQLGHKLNIAPMYGDDAAMAPDKTPPNEDEPSAATIGTTRSDVASTYDARDKWIYGKAMKTIAWETIRRSLERDHPNWEQLISPNGVKRAAIRYAKRHSLPLPPPRKVGRRARKNLN